MKKIALSFLVMSSILMAGCDQGSEYKLPKNSSMTEQSSVPTPPSSTVAETAEQAELKTYLAQMKEKDPSIVDAYYGYDEKGEKILHVIKKDETSTTESASGTSGVSDFMWSMAGGLTGAMLFNAFMNRGGMSGMTNSHAPSKMAAMNRNQYVASKSQAQRSYVSNPNTQKNIYGKPISNVNQPVSRANTSRMPVSQASQPVKMKTTYKRSNTGFKMRSKRR